MWKRCEDRLKQAKQGSITASDIRMVLVRTSHSGNIGAVARLMKNMGLSSLVLVDPDNGADAIASPDAVARAAGGADVLAGAIIVGTLEEALAGCTWVAGTSARSRSTPWPLVSPRAFTTELLAMADFSAHTIAIVFGRENSGLSNIELQMCNRHIMIPANPEYPVLNIAMAAQIISYEIRLMLDAQAGQPEQHSCGGDVDEPATHGAIESLIHALSRLGEVSGFLDPAEPKQFDTHLKRLFRRTLPEQVEINLLRGLLKTALRTIDSLQRKANDSKKDFE